jgi:hypothetical protein
VTISCPIPEFATSPKSRISWNEKKAMERPKSGHIRVLIAIGMALFLAFGTVESWVIFFK